MSGLLPPVECPICRKMVRDATYSFQHIEDNCSKKDLLGTYFEENAARKAQPPSTPSSSQTKKKTKKIRSTPSSVTPKKAEAAGKGSIGTYFVKTEKGKDKENVAPGGSQAGNVPSSSQTSKRGQADDLASSSQRAKKSRHASQGSLQRTRPHPDVLPPSASQSFSRRRDSDTSAANQCLRRGNEKDVPSCSQYTKNQTQETDTTLPPASQRSDKHTYFQNDLPSASQISNKRHPRDIESDSDASIVSQPSNRRHEKLAPSPNRPTRNHRHEESESDVSTASSNRRTKPRRETPILPPNFNRPPSTSQPVPSTHNRPPSASQPLPSTPNSLISSLLDTSMLAFPSSQSRKERKAARKAAAALMPPLPGPVTPTINETPVLPPPREMVAAGRPAYEDSTASQPQASQPSASQGSPKKKRKKKVVSENLGAQGLITEQLSASRPISSQSSPKKRKRNKDMSEDSEIREPPASQQTASQSGKKRSRNNSEASVDLSTIEEPASQPMVEPSTLQLTASQQSPKKKKTGKKFRHFDTTEDGGLVYHRREVEDDVETASQINEEPAAEAEVEKGGGGEHEVELQTEPVGKERVEVEKEADVETQTQPVVEEHAEVTEHAGSELEPGVMSEPVLQREPGIEPEQAAADETFPPQLETPEVSTIFEPQSESPASQPSPKKKRKKPKKARFSDVADDDSIRKQVHEFRGSQPVQKGEQANRFVLASALGQQAEAEVAQDVAVEDTVMEDAPHFQPETGQERTNPQEPEPKPELPPTLTSTAEAPPKPDYAPPISSNEDFWVGNLYGDSDEERDNPHRPERWQHSDPEDPAYGPVSTPAQERRVRVDSDKSHAEVSHDVWQVSFNDNLDRSRLLADSVAKYAQGIQSDGAPSATQVPRASSVMSTSTQHVAGTQASTSMPQTLQPDKTHWLPLDRVPESGKKYYGTPRTSTSVPPSSQQPDSKPYPSTQASPSHATQSPYTQRPMPNSATKPSPLRRVVTSTPPSSTPPGQTIPLSQPLPAIRPPPGLMATHEWGPSTPQKFAPSPPPASIIVPAPVSFGGARGEERPYTLTASQKTYLKEKKATTMTSPYFATEMLHTQPVYTYRECKVMNERENVPVSFTQYTINGISPAKPLRYTMPPTSDRSSSSGGTPTKKDDPKGMEKKSAKEKKKKRGPHDRAYLDRKVTEFHTWKACLGPDEAEKTDQQLVDEFQRVWEDKLLPKIAEEMDSPSLRGQTGTPPDSAVASPDGRQALETQSAPETQGSAISATPTTSSDTRTIEQRISLALHALKESILSTSIDGAIFYLVQLIDELEVEVRHIVEVFLNVFPSCRGPKTASTIETLLHMLTYTGLKESGSLKTGQPPPVEPTREQDPGYWGQQLKASKKAAHAAAHQRWELGVEEWLDDLSDELGSHYGIKILLVEAAYTLTTGESSSILSQPGKGRFWDHVYARARLAVEKWPGLTPPKMLRQRERRERERRRLIRDARVGSVTDEQMGKLEKLQNQFLPIGVLLEIPPLPQEPVQDRAIEGEWGMEEEHVSMVDGVEIDDY